MVKLTEKQNQIIHAFDAVSPEAFLEHYPYRYDFLEAKDFSEWKEGDTVVFEGKLSSSFRVARFGGKRSVTNFQVYAYDELVKVSIFNRPFLRDTHYTNGIVVVGTVGKTPHAIIAKTVSNKSLAENTGIKPNYPLKAGIKNFEIERLMKKILSESVIIDTMPRMLIDEYRLYSRQRALQEIHVPRSKASLGNALRTLKYDEFLRYHLSVALNNKEKEVGIAKDIDTSVVSQAIQALPYQLTEDQHKVIAEILADISSEKQMNRLLQGDVGSGKTVVALLTALAAIAAGYQVAFMVPTEILLYQHVKTFEKLFGSVSYAVLSNSTEDKKNVLDSIASGSAKLVFGTHSLFSDDVIFDKLGYVMIDEQHRFGVKQRQKLVSKGEKVDTLMLSATPIPRTLANSLFFDLDVSSIESYPSHRKLTETVLVEENSLRTIQDNLNKVLERGEQIYIVCAAIEEGEKPGVKNVVTIHKNLEKVFKGYRVAMLHGKMSSDEKETIMTEFNLGMIDILISTTVIEVGMDVHNANTMIVYNAEQFGLATLHQLRGRVGRGLQPGTCYLLSSSDTEISRERLNALATSHDGFELSMIDMRLRGFGDVLGIRQSGIPNFILGDIQKDEKILKQAKVDAKHIAEDRNNPEYRPIINRVLSQDYFKTT